MTDALKALEIARAELERDAERYAEARAVPLHGGGVAQLHPMYIATSALCESAVRLAAARKAVLA